MSSDSPMEALRHELLSDVAEHTTLILKQHGIETDVADQAGCSISNHLAEHWGGQVVSIPKDYLYKLSQRDQIIYEEFTGGTNHSALSRKYDVSVRAIYKIITRVRKIEVDKRQIQMF